MLGLLLLLCAFVPGSASAASSERLVSVRSTAVGGAVAPVTVVVHAPKTADVRIAVNGRTVAGAFTRAGTTRRVAHLSLRNGLRPGANRLVVTATAGGFRDVDVRTVRLPFARLLADAGRDRTLIVGRSVRVGAAVSQAVRDATAWRYRWRVTGAPKGARYTLRGATRAQPAFTPKTRGTYTLRLTTTARTGARAQDTLQLYAVPDDPPTGVRIETLAGGAGPQIVIDGRGMPNTGANDNGIYIAVVERHTRAVVEQGTAPRTIEGVRQVRGIATSWAAKGDYLVVLSGSRGIDASLLDTLDGFLAVIGGGKLTSDDRAKLAGGSPFSFIGDTNAPTGSAWINIPAKRDGVPAARTLAAANLPGSLVRGDVSDRYDYVSNDVPSFETHADTSPDQGNRMVIRGKRVEADLSFQQTTGIHVVALDPQNLDVLYNTAFLIGDPDINARNDQANALVRGLRTAATLPGNPIVLVQTIGKPIAASAAWTQAAAWIDVLGGDARQFNALDGTKSFALVGSRAAPESAVQASTVAGTGSRLDGSFARSRSHGFEPMIADSTGAADNGLAAIVNQPGQGFPAFDTPGLKAAATWVAKKAGICDEACDIRRQYWEQYRADWDHRDTKILSLADEFPSTQSDFTKADFTTVLHRLDTEIGYLLDSRTYFDQLAKPFGLADSQALIDVGSISKTLYDSLQPPPASNTTSYWLTLTGKIVAVVAGAAVVFPPAGATLSALAAGFALAGYLTQPDGSQVGGEILTRADGLNQPILDRLRSAQNSVQFGAVQIASDWGKLQAVHEKLASRKWAVAATDGRTLAQLRRALQQWIAQALVPVAYTRVVAAGGMTDSLSPSGGSPTDDITYLQCPGRPYPDVPLNAQLPAVTGFSPDGTPRRETFIVAHERGGSPPKSVLNLLFNAPDAASPGLGMDRWSFIDDRRFPYPFGTTHVARNACADIG